ncbi:MAG: choice-of-anchor M domain-containing protein [Sedimentisphaerales bacterium]|nr:choice-of-anchor M domain-containing protein [Sedimentisphaerales bacterium]
MRLRITTVLLCLLPAAGGDSLLFAVGQCAKISSDITTLYFGVETPIPDENHPHTIDTYHTDIDVSFAESGWAIQIFHDAPDGDAGDHNHDEGLASAEALLYVNSNARISLDSIPSGYEFIGAEAGETFWVLPQIAGSGALPLGFAAENADEQSLCSWNPDDPRGANIADKWFEVRLIDVRGPEGGDFSLWHAESGTAPVVFMSTYDNGINDDDVYYISAGSHGHMNWGFTKGGFYEVDLVVRTVYECYDGLSADLASRGFGDCRVNFEDYAILASHWLATGCGGEDDICEGADISVPSDGQVDWGDLCALAYQWLRCEYPGC